MTTQPSVDNEERNRLRLRAWKQRTQQTRQTTELNPKDLPLFGQPYKRNKGDELSDRIKKMLGSYEINNSSPFPFEPCPIPTAVTTSQSNQHQPSMDQSGKPQIHNPISTENFWPPANGYTPQYTRTSTTSSPNSHEHSSFSSSSPVHSRGGQPEPSTHQKKRRNQPSEPSEHFSLDQDIYAQSPNIKPRPIFHSSVRNNPETCESEVHRSTGHSSECPSTMDISTLMLKQSPKEAPVSQDNMANTQHSQNFAPLLSFKQPNLVPTQKPTAYVRPRNGQDQVVSESPETKLSSEQYVPQPELINKSDLDKRKTKLPLLEIRRDDAQFVENILMEMTSLLPPLLTTIHTPSPEELPKLLFPAKEAEGLSSRPVLKHPDHPPSDSAHQTKQCSSKSCKAAHSSGGESACSSGSDRGSESECDSLAEENAEPSGCSSVKIEPDAPGLNNGNWRLGKWIKSSQQSSSSEVQAGRPCVPETQTHKEDLPIPDPNFFHGEATSARVSKPQVSLHQHEFTEEQFVPNEHLEDRRDSFFNENTLKPFPSDVTPCSSYRSIPAKADQTEAALSEQNKVVRGTQTQCLQFTDGPKVEAKTKPGKRNRDRSDSKRDTTRAKHKSVHKLKTTTQPRTQVPPPLPSHCPPCCVHYPNICSCSTQSPAQPNNSTPASKVRGDGKKHKSEPVTEKSSKTLHQHTQIKSKKPNPPPPQSLLVKINLRLLLKDPKSSNHPQVFHSKGKTSTLIREKETGVGKVPTACKTDKHGKKNKDRKRNVENTVQPRKKQKLENNNTSSSITAVKQKTCRDSADPQGKKHPKKHLLQIDACKENTKDSMFKKSNFEKKHTSNEEKMKSKDLSKPKKCSKKGAEQPHSDKPKSPKGSLAAASWSQSSRKIGGHRPMLRFDERKCPVNHYIKEAKRLKHHADAESDRLSKAYNYLDAAMFFVESGIAMEKDPQTSTMSSYTMFAETVELLRFVLKLKHSEEPSSSPAENDFSVLCLKCQSLLQMAMFRYKYPTALKYSKILAEHFDAGGNASISISSSCVNGGGSQTIEQISLAYVNITTLVLNAHEVWEQMEEMAHTGSGMLAELDAVMGPLTLSSSMSSMVRYTRQGVHWLRHHTPKL